MSHPIYGFAVAGWKRWRQRSLNYHKRGMNRYLLGGKNLGEAAFVLTFFPLSLSLSISLSNVPTHSLSSPLSLLSSLSLSLTRRSAPAANAWQLFRRMRPGFSLRNRCRGSGWTGVGGVVRVVLSARARFLPLPDIHPRFSSILSFLFPSGRSSPFPPFFPVWFFRPPVDGLA